MLTVLTSIAVSGLLTQSRVISTTGSVMAIGVEVYWDQAGTNIVESIQWGVLAPGGSASETVWVKNTGNSDMSLSMILSGWSPSGADEYITVTWTLEDESLGAGETMSAVITVAVSSQVTGVNDFGFNIVIEGTA